MNGELKATVFKIKMLAKSECANYEVKFNSVKDCCLVKGACVFVTNEELARCKYFEEAVLPLDPELEAVYFAIHKANASGQELTSKYIRAVREANKVTKICDRCGKEFKPGNNRQRYCDICKKIISRDQARERMKKKKAKSVF